MKEHVRDLVLVHEQEQNKNIKFFDNENKNRTRTKNIETYNTVFVTQFMYSVLREKLCPFAQRYKDTNSYLDSIGSKIKKDIIILATPSRVNSLKSGIRSSH